uniref:UBC core domain-containing protein n=1 Tax=Eutreptiella gymnastica TaxID=73025 RepID=A0A7S4GJL7_9EUGL
MAEPLSEPSPDEDLDDAEAAAAAEERMQSVQRGFAAAKAAGVGAASRLMKELRQVSLSGNFEVTLVQDSLLVWEVRLFEWAFADDSPLHQDLQQLSMDADDLVAVVLRIHFPEDFPFGAPLVYVRSPVLTSEFIFDGALCMEMLVDWQPQYGNMVAMLVQITSFLGLSAARVASVAGTQPPAAQEKAREAYKRLKAFHQKKGWGAEAQR